MICKKMIAFIDTEVNPQNGKVLDYGAVREDEAVLHTHSGAAFEAFVSKCDVLCGHNIINHDLKYLNLKGNFTFIDTLPLSPLLFPKKPYHRLLKDDKLQTDELNNPVNDAKKAKDLFYDELAAWRLLPKKRQEIFTRLLNNIPEFCGFFDYLSTSSLQNSQSSLGLLIREAFEGQICENANIEAVVKHYPVELAYALALIGVDDLMSMTPAWVMHSYPKVGNVMNFLRNSNCGKCSYCKQRLDVHRGLKEYFGYDEFRLFDDEPMQQQAIITFRSRATDCLGTNKSTNRFPCTNTSET